jgi:hypothetical protein
VPTAAIPERAAVRSGVFDGIFDFAVHNGSTVQLVQCWSFQLPNQSDLAEQVKAWSWLVHEIRESGGELTYASGEACVPQDLDIFAVAIPPHGDADAPAYAEAQAAFAEIGVTEVAPDGARAVPAPTVLSRETRERSRPPAWSSSRSIGRAANPRAYTLDLEGR